MSIKTICSWCGVLMQEGPPVPVSHGMCATCQARIEADLVSGR